MLHRFTNRLFHNLDLAPTGVNAAGSIDCVSMASGIHGYGLSDLRDILTVIARNPEATLAKSRPAKLRAFLKVGKECFVVVKSTCVISCSYVSF